MTTIMSYGNSIMEVIIKLYTLIHDRHGKRTVLSTPLNAYSTTIKQHLVTINGHFSFLSLNNVLCLQVVSFIKLSRHYFHLFKYP